VRIEFEFVHEGAHQEYPSAPLRTIAGAFPTERPRIETDPEVADDHQASFLVDVHPNLVSVILLTASVSEHVRARFRQCKLDIRDAIPLHTELAQGISEEVSGDRNACRVTGKDEAEHQLHDA
jgi:hypothetical protein